MNTVTRCEGAGPIGRVDIFVFRARWRNEAVSNRFLRARLGCGQSDPSLTVGVPIGLRNEASGDRFLRARLGCGQLDPSLTVGVLIGLRNEASRSFTVAVLCLRNEATVLLQLA